MVDRPTPPTGAPSSTSERREAELTTLLLLGLLALCGRAEARPEPLLGPTGATWLGPLPPSTGEPGGADRGVVVIDPTTGQPWVSITDMTIPGAQGSLSLGRSWEGGAWRWLGEARLELSTTGTRLVRQGSPDATFPPLYHDAAEPWCTAGRAYESDRGDLLTCEIGGYALQRSDGALERFDENGLLVARSDDGQERSYLWGQDGLAGLTTPDGRTIRIGDARVQGRRRERIARDPVGGEVRYEYDSADRLVAVTTAAGLEHRYLYDDEGRLEVLVWGDGSRVVLRRDGEGRIVATEGPGAERWRFAWGEGGLQRAFDGRGAAWTIQREDGGVTVSDPAGRRATLLLDDGLPAGWRDPAGVTTRLRRDEHGRVNELIASDGSRWRFELDAQGRTSSLTGPAGDRWRIDRDEGLVRVTDPTGRARRYRIDGRGAVVEVDDGAGNVTIRRDRAGRVLEIVHGARGSTRIQRDAAGRITSITDGAGGEVRFSDHVGQLPGTIRGAEGSWRLLFDSLARPHVLQAPDGSSFDWTRGQAGELNLLRHDGSTTRFDRRLDGAITRLADPLGRLTGWTRDAMGRVTTWLRPDGSQLVIDRDTRGDVRRLGLGEQALRIERDAAGRPTGLVRTGTEDRTLLTWARDMAGRIRSVGWPQGSLELTRDAAGLVREVTLGERRWQIERDGAGRVRAVTEGDRSWRVRRDGTGMPTGLDGPDDALRIGRDPRGLAESAEIFGLGVRWRRDSAGRPARIDGPGGVSLGLQRDPSGRVTLARLPGGVLLHLDRDGLERRTRIEDANGRRIYEGRVVYDLLGRLSTSSDDSGTRHHRYGPFDEPISLESDHDAWSVLPGRLEGPPGTLAVITDERGRPAQATIELAAPAWGVARHELTYHAGEDGFVRRIEGDSGTAQLRHDALGRLLSVTITAPEGGDPVASWAIDWDPFGRPEAIHSAGETTTLCFLDGRLLGLRERGRTALLLGSPTLGVLAGEDGWVSLVTGAGGQRELALFPVGEPYIAASTPGGLRDLGYPGLLADGGRLQLFPGGPLLGPQDARDPLSGLPTAAQDPLPWSTLGWPAAEEHVEWPQLDGATTTAWAPDPWDPDPPWADPIALLMALGELQPLLDAPWWSPRAPAAPLPWMPASLEGRPPAALPPPDALPIREEPLAAHFLAAALPPARPVDTAALLRTLLADDLADIPAGWPSLPPPTHIPELLE